MITALLLVLVSVPAVAVGRLWQWRKDNLRVRSAVNVMRSALADMREALDRVGR